MKILIKSLTSHEENYNRFGRLIPTKETEIDIEEYFSVKKDRAVYILSKLRSDKKIEIKEVENVKITAKKETPVEIVLTEEVKEETPTRGRKPRGN